MKSNYALIDRLEDLYKGVREKVRFYFAKKWLDSLFGENDWWGDELIKWKRAYDDLRKEGK